MGPPEPRRIPRIHEILIEFFAEVRSYSAGTGIALSSLPDKAVEKLKQQPLGYPLSIVVVS